MSIKRLLQISSVVIMFSIIGGVVITGIGYLSWAAITDIGRWGFLFPTYFVALGILAVVGLPKEMR